MRVGVDATSWDNARGFGRFARNAVAKLVELDHASAYFMIAPPANGPPLPPETETLRLRESVGRPRPADGARPLGELWELGNLTRRARLDAVLFPSVYTWFPVPGVPSVVGVHDVIAATLPTLTFPSRRARRLWAAKETLAIRTAARIFTVSRASHVAVTRRWGLAPERVSVVPEAPASVFSPRSPEAAEEHQLALGLRAGEPFLLFAGGVSPHKNLASLVGALARLHARQGAPRLVVVGDLHDDKFLSSATKLRARIAELGLRGRVLTPGYVSDETLAALYSTATAVVIPSLAEGFGLPAVEAAACGAALVLSDVPAHRENLDGAALFTPPRDEERLANAIARVASDSRLRAELAARARRRVAPLSWEAAGRALREVLGEAGA